MATLSAALATVALWPDSFGAKPRAERVQASPNFRDGAFRNLPAEPVSLGERMSIKDWFTADNGRVPPEPPPVHRPDPADLAVQGDRGLRVTWMGHSSLLMEIDGTLILTDPVWAERASPFQWAGPGRFTPPPLPLSEVPTPDAVVISHDHYDHLDHHSIQALSARGVPFVVPLGVGTHLESWGVPAERITELDWWERTRVGELELVATPAHHFSGRGPKRNPTLWASWALIGPEHRVWYSGDTGPWKGFDEIGDKLGPFDMSFIEVGARHPSWADIHLGPLPALQVHQQVQARVMLPIHWGTFALALHAWDQPIVDLLEGARAQGVTLSVPLVGQTVDPSHPEVHPFWEGRLTAERKTGPM